MTKRPGSRVKVGDEAPDFQASHGKWVWLADCRGK
jgi:hypothetical protein